MVKSIAFICVGNSARSQIAEAIAKKMIKDRNLDLKVYSAGTNPCGYINAMAIRILEEQGISIEGQYSKGIEDIPLQEIDLFILVCEQSNCLNLPGKKVIHWFLPDPFYYEQFYFITESLKSKIQELLDMIQMGKI
ncbi:MAG: arsenate reductase ArsC [Candidatus Calescibacterium sp.]|nr:arsenate reductase ArsC [Candidatus Calescibacterium sp.]MCX7972151.1 arsenate reductase ArsC [bacterium]MDW8194840.1 arsenate reductase ArsC [Candidatus Calescibacterium sp.]